MLQDGDVPGVIRMDPQYVDLVALVERAINFCHTGAARVLSTASGNPLWFTRSILDGHMPMFSRSALSFVSRQGAIIPELPITAWPTHKRTGQPIHAAERALMLTYGNDLFQVGSAVLVLQFI